MPGVTEFITQDETSEEIEGTRVATVIQEERSRKLRRARELKCRRDREREREKPVKDKKDEEDDNKMRRK
ncbi:hypothetical protein RUM43_008649 [Polyplax serrata]|uniref:Uncharacterized protein n=1 Tax=Polyplax serrata TaxID=468196 RepID=A0AAN8NYS9_POLSC